MIRLIVAALCCAVLVVTVACTRQQTAEMATYAGINRIREAHGLPALDPDASLVQVARIRSQDMASLGYFSHYPPDGCNYVCLIDRVEGAHEYAGENIAWNNYVWAQSPQVAVRMWENSPEHLENILNCHYERFGTGVAVGSDGKIYYTMIFEGMRSC